MKSASSCMFHRVFHSLSEKQLQNQTSFTLVKKTPLKSCPISPKNLPGLKKSIVCTVVERIFEFVKNEGFIQFLAKKLKNFTGN